MKGFSLNFQLLLPISALVVIVPWQLWQTPETTPPQASTIQASSNPLIAQIQWENFLQDRPRFNNHQESLLKLSSRIPLEKFQSLSPALQERLASYATSRLDPTIPAMALCWEPGVSTEVMEAFHAAEEMSPDESPEFAAATQFDDGDRWGRTATFSSFFESGEQGLPTTLRWSFMPDGTSIAGFNGEPTSDSDLITFLDNRYGVTSGGPITPLIESGDDWKYLDDGSNQGTTWRATGFDDTAWATGPSQLGYGDNDEATTVSFGGDTNNKHPATYFRKTFTITDPNVFASFALNFTYDDSIVIYLNGSEIARENIASNPAFDDFADGTGPENGTASRTLSTSSFQSGNNTLAVEIHQASLTSSDISFDLDLTGIPEGGSDLTTRPWFPVFEAAFDNIASLTGITYVYEPNDDGAALSNFSRPSGSLNVRGDIRIGGHFVDGETGSNTLAYNFSPAAGGDMIIDTGNPSFYGNTSSNSLNLRNVIEHEHGHGLGLNHVCPITQTKLMEPFISRLFRGLQLDDIFSLNRLYGDFFEKQNSSRNNDSIANAATLPVTITEPFDQEFLSIDDNSDDDFYRIDNVTPGTAITCRVTPVSTPSSFVEGPQNSDGSCSAGSTFDFTNIHDLDLALISPDGSTTLTLANSQPLGMPEEIVTFEAPASGNYYLRVTGDNSDNTQLYRLEVELNGPSPYQQWASLENLPAALASPTQDADSDGIFNLQEYYFGLSPLSPDSSPLVTSAISADGSEYLFSFTRDPSAQIDSLIFEASQDLISWFPFSPTNLSITQNGALEDVTLTLPTSSDQGFIRLGLDLSE